MWGTKNHQFISISGGICACFFLRKAAKPWSFTSTNPSLWKPTPPEPGILRIQALCLVAAARSLWWFRHSNAWSFSGRTTKNLVGASGEFSPQSRRMDFLLAELKNFSKLDFLQKRKISHLHLLGVPCHVRSGWNVRWLNGCFFCFVSFVLFLKAQESAWLCETARPI